MMETADLWKGDYLSRLGGLDRPWHGTVLAQSKVRARTVIVIQIGSENTSQMAFIENDDVIEALPPDRADNPFNVGILPWRTRCRDDFIDAHGLDSGVDQQPVNAVPIPNHIAWCGVPRESFCHLLLDPGRGWMSRHAEMDDPPSLVM